MSGVPDLGAVPALQDFTLLIECPHLAVAFHPPMPTQLIADVCDDDLQKNKNGSPVSEETNEPFQEQTVWIRLGY